MPSSQYQHQAKTFEGGTPAATRWQHHHEQHHSSSVVEQPRTAQQQSTIRQQWILLKCELEFVAVLEWQFVDIDIVDSDLDSDDHHVKWTNWVPIIKMDVRMMIRMVTSVILWSLVSGERLECPEPSGIFPDPEQCDKYFCILRHFVLLALKKKFSDTWYIAEKNSLHSLL